MSNVSYVTHKAQSTLDYFFIHLSMPNLFYVLMLIREGIELIVRAHLVFWFILGGILFLGLSINNIMLLVYLPMLNTGPLLLLLHLNFFG